MTNKTAIKRAIYPGTFDPVTNGHLSLMERACHLFDELVVAVSTNATKAPLFDFEERLKMVIAAVKGKKFACKITVIGFDGLLAELAKKEKAVAIIRGLRALTDFEYEFQMALMNRKMAREVETVFLMPSLSWVYLSSTLVKDVARNGGDVSELVPPHVLELFEKKLKPKKKN
ncbi:MAG: pantetheine-phosphate adenylyltransferase [Candidatus Zixiibacteriota bacterium]